jgi:Domain of unknown function (DUF4326)
MSEPNLATYVQRRRTAGWTKPEGALSCTRGRHPNRWANPYRVGAPAPCGGKVTDHAHAVRLYADLVREDPDLVALALRELTGRTLMCWCRPGAACHVQDVLLPLVNEGRQP